MALKHVGRTAKNKRKVVVAYRVVPGDGDSCIVVTTENLMAEEHDALMKAVESDAGQSAYEFAEVMARTRLPDGRNMLAGFHTTGKMVKINTNEIEMTPDNKTVIMLNELNQLIATQKGVSVEDLAIQPSSQPKSSANAEPQEVAEAAVEPLQTATDGVLTDEQLAAQYRSQADRLYKEAKRLREEADALSPIKKKTAKTTESA